MAEQEKVKGVFMRLPEDGATGKCPHCNTSVRFELSKSFSQQGFSYYSEEGSIRVYGVNCPACKKLIVCLLQNKPRINDINPANCRMLYPLGSARPSVPLEIPEQIAQDYKEACLVEPLSKKASAALARRCLQNVLRDPNAGNVKHNDLSKEIDQVIPTLPTALAESIDAVRNIGNFGAHPIKSQHSGEIVDVEPEEAEWILDTLEELFDHYYVKPQRIKQKRDALNEKLNKAGKPPLK